MGGPSGSGGIGLGEAKLANGHERVIWVGLLRGPNGVGESSLLGSWCACDTALCLFFSFFLVLSGAL